MAKQEISGKALLDKLYSGLDTMPAVEAELNARELRNLNDEFLGKPAGVTASGARAATASRGASKARPASGGKLLRTALVVVFSVGLAGVIAAQVLRDSDRRAAVTPPPAVVLPAPDPVPVEQVAELTPPPEPVVLTNPFDKTEKFTFPPGTSKADARDQMAAMLLQRAVDRGAHVQKKPRKAKLASEPRTPKAGHGS